jgi:GH25 family lysozyme M1 (1,4-beta-N-acetylmuramidase)
MTDVVRFLDVSKWQVPSLFNYEEAAKLYSGAMVRACYGDTPDKRCVEHVRGFRDAGLAIGLYIFWRDRVNAVDQWHCFNEVADKVRYGTGDVAPGCDIEDDGTSEVCPPWSESARVFVQALEGQWGRCLVYCSRRDWVRLGEPEWMLRRPLWVPHWLVDEPDTPGDVPWAMHQTGAEVVPGMYPYEVDVNRARLPLPTIPDPHDRERIEGLAALTADGVRRGLYL